MYTKHRVRKRDDESTLEQSCAASKAPMSSQRKETPTLAMKREAARKATLVAFDMLHQNVAATAEVMKRSPTTIRTWVKESVKKTMGKRDRHSLGYAVDYEPWLEDFVREAAMMGKAVACMDIQTAWETKFGQRLPRRTLHRITKDLGIRARKQRLVQRLTFHHKAKRLAFAQGHLSVDFSKWMFTDAHQIYIGVARHKGSSTTMVPRGVNPTVEYTKDPPRIKVYGGITVHGFTRLLLVTGTTGRRSRYLDATNKRAKGVGSEEYRKDVLPWLFQEGKRLFKKRKWTFQQDGDGAHRSKETTDVLRQMSTRENVQVVFDWPPMSPDLSPIENAWALLDRKVAALQPTTLDELIGAAQRAWKELSQAGMGKRLVESVPRRLEEVVQMKGDRTKY